MLRLPTENTSDEENKMKICKLSDIARFTTGKLNSNAATMKGRYPFFTCAPKPLTIDTYAYDTKAVILAGNNAEGNFHIQYYEGKFNAYQRTYIIETNDETIVDIRYLYYALKICLLHFKQISQGTATKFLTAKILNAFELPIPRIEEQQKIAFLLAEIDEKIKTNEIINNNLEQQAKSIFDNMFPNISNGSCTIGDYITPKRGKSLLSKNAIFGDVPVIAGGLEPSTYHNVANTRSPVLAISASGANAGYVSLWNIPIWSSDSSYIDSSMTDDVYFWYVLLKKRQKEIFDAQTGSAQPHIYPQHIASMSVSNLDIEEVHSYTSIVTPIFEIIGHHKEENTRLASLRDTLLPKLMSGELDVSDIEI